MSFLSDEQWLQYFDELHERIVRFVIQNLSYDEGLATYSELLGEIGDLTNATNPYDGVKMNLLGYIVELLDEWLCQYIS